MTRFYNYKEITDLTGVHPFSDLGEWMKKITDSVVMMSLYDYWLCVPDEADDDEVKARWKRKILQMDGYCCTIGPSVEARLNAAANPKAGVAKTKTKFNDAPDTAGDWSSDEHMSTVTSAESTAELSSAEEDEIGKIYGIMSAVADDIMRKFVIRAEFA